MTRTVLTGLLTGASFACGLIVVAVVMQLAEDRGSVEHSCINHQGGAR